MKAVTEEEVKKFCGLFYEKIRKDNWGWIHPRAFHAIAHYDFHDPEEVGDSADDETGGVEGCESLCAAIKTALEQFAQQ